MPTSESVLGLMEQDARALHELSESALLVELGRRIRLADHEIAHASVLTASAQVGLTPASEALAGPMDFFRNAGRAFLNRFNRQMYLLCCDASDPDHVKVKSALDLGADAAAAAIGALLIGVFGWLPGIASVIAMIVVKRFSGGIHGAICDAWKKEL